MKERDIAIVGRSERRWRGSGENEPKDGCRLLYSRGQNGTNGVGRMIRKVALQYVEEVKMTSDRSIIGRVGCERGTQDVLEIYAPQTGCKEEDIEESVDEVEKYV